MCSIYTEGKMITYTVSYKKIGKWKKIKNVKGDSHHKGMRIIVCEDETLYEIPLDYIFKFSKERWLNIKERMSNEAGQEIRIDKR